MKHQIPLSLRKKAAEFPVLTREDAAQMSDEDLQKYTKWYRSYAAETRNQIISSKTPQDRNRLEAGLSQIMNAVNVLDKELEGRFYLSPEYLRNKALNRAQNLDALRELHDAVSKAENYLELGIDKTGLISDSDRTRMLAEIEEKYHLEANR